MKNTVKILCLAAALSLVLSCKKESLQPASPDNYVKMEFSAQCETTKTSIADGTGNERIVSWVKDDKIKIAWSAEGYAQASAGSAGESTVFSAEVASDAENFIGIYPYDSPVILDFANTSATLDLPVEQDGIFEHANYMMASTSVVEQQFSFKNSVALIKFTLSTGEIKKVRFKALGEASLTGRVTNFPDGSYTVSENGAGREVTVNVNGAGTYYAAVLPGTDLPNGLAIYLSTSDKDLPVIYTTEQISIARSCIADVGTIDEKVALTGYYIKTGGTGRGTSWDDAGGLELLRSLLGGKDEVSADRVNGTEIHVASGVYVLPTSEGDILSKFGSEVSYTVSGGYSAASTGNDLTSLEGETVFSADINGDGLANARVLGIGESVNATFNRISFVKGNSPMTEDGTAPDDGGAINVSSACATFNECSFRDNTLSVDNSGGAIAGVSAVIVLNKCDFSGNYARNGASVWMKGESSSLTLEDCSVNGDHTYNTAGSVNISGGVANIRGCTFTGTYTETGTGGAIHANATGVVVKLYNCDFNGTYAGTQGGAISLQTADVYAENCTFTETYSSGHGGVAVLNSEDSKLTLKDCTITKAYSSAGNSGAVSVNGGELLASGTTFDGCTLKSDNNSPVARINKWLSGSADGDPCKATFTGCTFKNNVNPGASYKYSAGCCAIGKAQVTFDECKFENNKASRGSCFTTVTADAKVEVKNCIFTGNAATEYGVYNNEAAGASVNFSNCTFENNTSLNQGAIFYADYASSNIYVTGCKFKGNSSGANGAICSNYSNRAGTVWHFDDCYFEANTPKSRALFMANNECVFMINNCRFYNNTFKDDATSAWGIISHGKAVVCMNNCTCYNDESKPAMLIVNSDSHILCVNSTMICSAVSSNEKAAFRVNNASGKLVLANNVILKRGGTVVFTDGSPSVTSKNNVYGSSWGYGDAGTSVAINSESDLGTASYNQSSQTFLWSGPSIISGFTAATKDDVLNAISAFSVKSSGLSDVGASFKTWLETLASKPLDRSYAWPGAYTPAN